MIKTWDEYILQIQKMDLSKCPLIETDDPDCRKEGDCALVPGIYGNYEFQNAMAMRLGGKMLNAACADDPAKLGWLGATNMDLHEIDVGSSKDFRKVANYVQGSVLEMKFSDAEFDTVILGEFLEHCKFDVAVKAINECRRVLKPGGHLVMTFPLDGRTRDEQRAGNVWPQEYDAGITCHHQTWWGTKDIQTLRERSRMVEVMRAALLYLLTSALGGWGLVWRKP